MRTDYRAAARASTRPRLAMATYWFWWVWFRLSWSPVAERQRELLDRLASKRSAPGKTPDSVDLDEFAAELGFTRMERGFWRNTD